MAVNRVVDGKHLTIEIFVRVVLSRKRSGTACDQVQTCCRHAQGANQPKAMDARDHRLSSLKAAAISSETTPAVSVTAGISNTYRITVILA
jgi:hypothetical protein